MNIEEYNNFFIGKIIRFKDSFREQHYVVLNWFPKPDKHNNIQFTTYIIEDNKYEAELYFDKRYVVSLIEYGKFTKFGLFSLELI